MRKQQMIDTLDFCRVDSSVLPKTSQSRFQDRSDFEEIPFGTSIYLQVLRGAESGSLRKKWKFKLNVEPSLAK